MSQLQNHPCARYNRIPNHRLVSQLPILVALKYHIASKLENSTLTIWLHKKRLRPSNYHLRYLAAGRRHRHLSWDKRVQLWKRLRRKIDRGESFVTPKTLSYTPRENSEVTLWILGDEDVDFTEIEIESTSPRSNSPIFQPVSQVRQPRLTAQTILTTNIILPTFA